MNTLYKKTCCSLLLLVAVFLAHSGDTYRKFLLSKIAQQKTYSAPHSLQTTPASCIIPRYEIPKGNIFCRMEDKLTKATGIWIKVGVK
jgi:hypothetical protein